MNKYDAEAHSYLEAWLDERNLSNQQLAYYMLALQAHGSVQSMLFWGALLQTHPDFVPVYNMLNDDVREMVALAELDTIPDFVPRDWTVDNE